MKSPDIATFTHIICAMVEVINIATTCILVHYLRWSILHNFNFVSQYICKWVDEGEYITWSSPSHSLEEWIVGGGESGRFRAAHGSWWCTEETAEDTTNPSWDLDERYVIYNKSIGSHLDLLWLQNINKLLWCKLAASKNNCGMIICSTMPI